MPSEAPIEAPPGAGGPPADDRRRHPALARLPPLARARCRRAAGGAVSIAALVALDVVGLALGLYVALVLRAIVYGDTIYWSLLWDTGPAEWLPFLAPITVLVFLQAGLYAPRERRAGAGRIVSSLVLVALIVLAFGLGTDYDFTTTGLIPTAVVTCALAIGVPPRGLRVGLARAAAGSSGSAGASLLVGEGESLRRPRSGARAPRGAGSAIDVVGAVAPARGPVCRCSAPRSSELAACSSASGPTS